MSSPKDKIKREQWRRKQSKSHKGQVPWCVGKHLSQDHKDKISESEKGKIISLKVREKISETCKKRGIGEWMIGRKRSEGTRKRISDSNKLEKHWNWQGGRSFEPYSVDWTETLRRSIRERDNYICQLCSQYGNNVHHIDYDKQNCNPNNLITLCRGCNAGVNSNRDYWANYFQSRLCQIK